ncbi:MAG: hypothetical protein JSV47_07605 [Deltaproteobacteria bacterium]|nr:MAG: hypothetical protein JSV47_07605 [Deltaproteobacteria bacterium]
MRMRSKTILLSVVIALLFSTQCKKEVIVPDELVGIWETKYPGYTNRDIQITKDTIVFEQGEGYFDFVTYPIVGIDKTVDDTGNTLYVVYYVIPEGLKYEFPIYYSPEKGGTFRFKNRPQIKWTRKKSQP